MYTAYIIRIFQLLASCLKSALGEGPPQTAVNFILSNKIQDLEESSIPYHPSDETIARRKLLSQPQMKDYLSRYNSSCWWLAEVVKDCFANPTGEIHTEEALHYVDCTDINCSLNLRSQILGANFVYYPELFNNISSHAKDLITKLLKVNPVADDSLRHPWQDEDNFANPNEGRFDKIKLCCWLVVVRTAFCQPH